MLIIENYKSEINRLCAKHKVKHLYVFGSALTGRYNSESDIDLIVDFDPIELAQYADNYYDFKFALQDVFKRPVDLLEERSIKNPYFIENINKHKALVYGH